MSDPLSSGECKHNPADCENGVIDQENGLFIACACIVERLQALEDLKRQLTIGEPVEVPADPAAAASAEVLSKTMLELILDLSSTCSVEDIYQAASRARTAEVAALRATPQPAASAGVVPLALPEAVDEDDKYDCPHFGKPGSPPDGYGVTLWDGLVMGLCGDCYRSIGTEFANMKCDEAAHAATPAGDETCKPWLFDGQVYCSTHRKLYHESEKCPVGGERDATPAGEVGE